MAIKSKSDLWSVIAVMIALVSLVYCSSFLLDFIFEGPSAEWLAELRDKGKG
ncbi:hypothetical protein [Planomicrobium sp. YIM 101495]|uniref:hypothetical protein n=1 Tax=Planomicrobium sp. YIM 101495 TaxID=2665160 RepID=UPI0012B6E81B|nr:hypothetical protein [Planomicrobium sp. YIM 101495]MTD30947.1 hypothetical protein [Planomicrobium sp. YIM 101495]